LGWNRVDASPASRFLQSGHAYFAHSYCLRVCPDGWIANWAEYGGRFVAALERGGVLACQFHPELSSEWGQRLLRKWIECELPMKAAELARC
jgi:imidazoleglycerol phosphate synthase glutamine amidotransferase subunit HisH